VIGHADPDGSERPAASGSFTSPAQRIPHSRRQRPSLPLGCLRQGWLSEPSGKRLGSIPPRGHHPLAPNAGFRRGWGLYGSQPVIGHADPDGSERPSLPCLRQLESLNTAESIGERTFEKRSKSRARGLTDPQSCIGLSFQGNISTSSSGSGSCQKGVPFPKANFIGKLGLPSSYPRPEQIPLHIPHPHLGS